MRIRIKKHIKLEIAKRVLFALLFLSFSVFVFVSKNDYCIGEAQVKLCGENGQEIIFFLFAIFNGLVILWVALPLMAVLSLRDLIKIKSYK